MKILFLTTQSKLSEARGIARSVTEATITISLSQPDDLKDEFDKYDVVYSWFYPYIIPSKYILNNMYNCHISALPFGAGAMPNLWAIIEGTPAGITIHHIDEGIDTGAAVMQQRIIVKKTDTGVSLYEKLVRESIKMTISFLNKLTRKKEINSFVPHGTRTYHNSKEIEKAKNLVYGFDDDERRIVEQTVDAIRACHFPPHPGAFLTYRNGTTVRIKNIELEIVDNA